MKLSYHYIIASIIIGLGFVVQPFSMVLVQNTIAPKMASLILGNQAGNSGSNDPDKAVGTKISLENAHLKGNPEAKIFLVEYSDMECPFCERFHSVAQSVVDKSAGNVAWIYRHFPLSIHPGAEPTAIYSECVASVGGSEAFWKFIDADFKNSRKNDQASLEKYTQLAGVDQAAVTACVKNSEAAQKIVQDQLAEGSALGIQGTPGTFVAKKEGNEYVLLEFINGALPEEAVQQIIEKYSK